MMGGSTAGRDSVDVKGYWGTPILNQRLSVLPNFVRSQWTSVPILGKVRVNVKTTIVVHKKTLEGLQNVAIGR